MWSRTGGVPAHPDNAYRLLHDQQQLALVFPEGTKATSKTYTDRYRLRRFGRGGFVEIAMRAGVPDRPHRRGRRRGVHAHPLPDPERGQGAQPPLLPGHGQLAAARARSATSPTSRPSSSSGSSTRSPSTSSPGQERYSRSRVMDEAERDPGAPCRTPSTTCCASAAASGSADPMGRRVLITGLDTFWGGRMAQALEAEPDVEMILGLGTKEPTVPLERTEFVRSDQKYSILSRIVRATQVDTIVHTFLETNSVEVTGRVLHEINVIGTLNLLAAAGASRRLGAQGGRQVLDPRLRRGRDRTRPGSARRTPGPARCGPGSSGPCSRSSRWSATSPRTTPTWP